MKIILSTDPIRWPLTGIGRYTYELARRLESNARVTDCRFFNYGRWQQSKDFLPFGDEKSRTVGSPSAKTKGLEFLRKSLANSELAVKVYSRVMPLIYNLKLSRFSSSHLYHSPNFILPSFGGRKIVTFHDLSIFKYPEFHPESRVSLMSAETQKAARNADHIITVSEAVREEVIDFFSRSPDDVTAVHLASFIGQSSVSNAEKGNLLSRFKLRSGQFFLFISSIEPRKNISRILDAFEALPEGFKKEHPLVLAGSSGWKSGDILKRIKKLSDSGSVIYLGYINDVELECLYESAGALVFPSIYEGFGLPIIESQSKGVPVITSRISCMPEVSGGAALLVDPYNSEDIGQAMEKIMLDAGIREDLSHRGHLNAQKFSWDRMLTETLDVYEKILIHARSVGRIRFHSEKKAALTD